MMMQVKKRSDNGKSRFMMTICFYQDSRHDKPLHWIRKMLGIGYVSQRNDNITELRINGYQRIDEIITKLLPFIKFKKIQAKALLRGVRILKKKKLQKRDYDKLIDIVLEIQSENYVTKKKKTKKELLKILGLTP